MKFSKKDFTATNVIIFITVVAYIIQINVQHGNLLFGLNLYFLLGGFYWQPLTSMFSHGGIAHLGMNMFVLWQFGNLIEQARGKKRFITLYLVTGILTSLLSFLYIFYIDIQVNLVGASGAICAILGYIAYFDKRQRSGIITWILLISVAPLLIGLPIAWYAHFIGLAIGFIYAIIEKRFFPLVVYR
ncbi:rhomboid family intramembrane serine protease [Aliarcobacter lanthieri]|uniref:rhomboid family intramembrane serine protease n=1 Tax=Aliarcobacter lanthieri TaxID=1355374 RepID=UPI003AAE03C5